MTRLYAKGRVRSTGMNGLETDYARELELLKRAGEVEWFAYEAVRLRLADNTFYVPDFLVLLGNGELQVHEVKGHWEDDARVKIKVAAELFPFRFLAITRRLKRDGGGFVTEAFG